MTCSCRDTTSKTYTIERTANSYRVLEAGKVVTSCGGTLNVLAPRGYECIRLIFNYATSYADDPLLPLYSVGTCPCETDTNYTSTLQQFVGRFEIPRSATCSYLWTLTQSLPPCRIDIVIHAP